MLVELTPLVIVCAAYAVLPSFHWKLIAAVPVLCVHRAEHNTPLPTANVPAGREKENKVWYPLLPVMAPEFATIVPLIR